MADKMDMETFAWLAAMIPETEQRRERPVAPGNLPAAFDSMWRGGRHACVDRLLATPCLAWSELADSLAHALQAGATDTARQIMSLEGAPDSLFGYQLLEHVLQGQNDAALAVVSGHAVVHADLVLSAADAFVRGKDDAQRLQAEFFRDIPLT